ncbi:hypothetical protein BpHYR1_001870 [Brachionus plicatilis]|uniref:Uncharacterized protein n=1 Tax=Brachionus plicatilis TaxID=10195 RepID=A0A3M7Q5Z2_BRAPC|nr:hypothetical protein BpHYR1_001870 [Brachionus plicatilis]
MSLQLKDLLNEIDEQHQRHELNELELKADLCCAGNVARRGLSISANNNNNNNKRSCHIYNIDPQISEGLFCKGVPKPTPIATLQKP